MRQLQQALFLLTSVLLCAAPANAQSEPDGEKRRIREIRIEIAPIYTEEQAAKSSWAGFVNRHHTRTRESVIRTDLLINEGDVFDQELLEASERSLRRFKFLNKVKISMVPVDEENVDVEVFTKEAWTLEPGITFEGGGDLATVTAHLIEFNLFGLGKKLFAEAIYQSDVGTTGNFGYSDYQLFNTRWVGIARYKTGPLIESYSVQIKRPLYSPDSKWSFGGSAYTADSIVRLFEEGDESSRFEKESVQVVGSMQRAFGPRFQKTNLKFNINYKKIDHFSLGAETTEPLPPDQANVTPTIGVSTGKTSWVKKTFIDKMGITEDKWIGHRYGGRLGYGIPLEDSLELWNASVFGIKNFALPNRQLLYLNASVSSEIVRNTFVSVGARYYKNFSRHTLAMRFKTNIGYELDSSKQFQLGADSGLRGYPARQFTGEKLMLINLEDRQFWGTLSVGPKFALGTVLFVDAGNVWKDEQDIDLKDLNWSTGFGVRIALSNMPKTPIFRLDLGWAIFGESNFAVTVGTEQHF